MKKAIVPLALIIQSAYLAANSFGQTTVYNDNFANDGSLSSSYMNINNISGTSDEWSFSANSELTLTTAASSKLDEIAGSFSAVSLANAGDYLSFQATFNSPSLGQGGTTSAGALLFALDNSGGVGLTSLGAGPESPTATTGATAGYVGDLGDIALNNSPKTGTKFYAKTGTGNNDLAYYSDATPDTQLSTSIPNANNANLANNDSYTLTYTITSLNAGASQDQFTVQLYDNTLGAIADSFSYIGTNSSGAYITPTTKYDTFDLGIYTGSESTGYNVNLTDLAVITNVPEPSVMALAGAAFGLFGVMRFRRR
ncbi:MAG TPA: PEP-CTERM sorting domain-containing protein [Verrucomicrobiae bacterium]|jgi:hypothetical protein